MLYNSPKCSNDKHVISDHCLYCQCFYIYSNRPTIQKWAGESFFHFYTNPSKRIAQWYERRPKQVALPFVWTLYRLTMFALPRIARGKASFVFTRHVRHFLFHLSCGQPVRTTTDVCWFLAWRVPFEPILMLSFFLFSLSRWDRDARFKNLLSVPVTQFSHWTHLLRSSSVGPMLLALHDGTFVAVAGICP